MCGKFKSHILTFRSPIRWGFLGLGIAASLFLAEITLSFLQVFLSLLGGDVMVASWVQIFVAVMTGISFLICIAIFGLTVYVGVLWYKNKSNDETLLTVQAIQKNEKTIIGKLDKKEGEARDGD